jgi:hypothetical protein
LTCRGRAHARVSSTGGTDRAPDHRLLVAVAGWIALRPAARSRRLLDRAVGQPAPSVGCVIWRC